MVLLTEWKTQRCITRASRMHCTILRFREAVSFNQVPYPAGTVSSFSSCRYLPPWSHLLLALAPGWNRTSLHNRGAPPLQEVKSTDEWTTQEGPQQRIRISFTGITLMGKRQLSCTVHSLVDRLQVHILFLILLSIFKTTDCIHDAHQHQHYSHIQKKQQYDKYNII